MIGRGDMPIVWLSGQGLITRLTGAKENCRVADSSRPLTLAFYPFLQWVPEWVQTKPMPGTTMSGVSKHSDSRRSSRFSCWQYEPPFNHHSLSSLPTLSCSSSHWQLEFLRTGCCPSVVSLGGQWGDLVYRVGSSGRQWAQRRQ